MTTIRVVRGARITAAAIELLDDFFGPRVIGLQIGRFGDGMSVEHRVVKGGSVPVYTVGRSYLLELLHRELEANRVRFAAGPATQRAFEQLMSLEVEYRDSGTVYQCPVGRHDDLAMSVAMLAFVFCHPDLQGWTRMLRRACQPPRRPPDDFNWAAVT